MTVVTVMIHGRRLSYTLRPHTSHASSHPRVGRQSGAGSVYGKEAVHLLCHRAPSPESTGNASLSLRLCDAFKTPDKRGTALPRLPVSSRNEPVDNFPVHFESLTSF